MSEVTDALAAWRDGSLSREGLFRRLLAYENWQLPTRPERDADPGRRFALADAKLIPDAAGRAQIFLFSAGYDTDPFDAAQAATGGCGYSNPTGWEIFAVDLEGVGVVIVDPGTPHEFVIERAEFAELKPLADAVGIEEAWGRLREGFEEDDDLSRVAHYPAYHLAAVQREGGDVLIYTPHPAGDDGRKFVPIFTHTDTLALALDEFRETFAPAEVKILKLGGEKAFPVLAQQHEIDGIVLNFRGPAEPIAFDSGVTELLLAELAKERR